LTITLASQGSISFGVGAALILGANLGTTTIPLIASAAFRREGKRLALAHFFLKLFGVGITLLFFSYFLTVIDLLIPGEAKGAPLAFHLAAVHTGFNLISLTFWSLLSPLILWLVCWLLPDPAMDTVRTLSPAVWRILVSSPKRALQEAQEQIAQMRLLIKDLSDTCTELLRSPQNTESLSRISPIRLTRRFEPIREGLYYLLLRCEPQQLDAEQRRFIQKQLRQIEAHSILFDEGIKLLAHLEMNARASQNALPAEWLPLLDRFAKQLNDLWNSVLLSREEDAHTLRLQRSLNKLDEVNHKRWQNSPQDRHQDVVWRYQLLASLRRFAALLQSLNHPTASPPSDLLAADLPPAPPITTPLPAPSEE
jgi:Na+/phosphate symporter